MVDVKIDEWTDPSYERVGDIVGGREMCMMGKEEEEEE